jgi:hypothetical protein
MDITKAAAALGKLGGKGNMTKNLQEATKQLKLAAIILSQNGVDVEELQEAKKHAEDAVTWINTEYYDRVSVPPND